MMAMVRRSGTIVLVLIGCIASASAQQVETVVTNGAVEGEAAAKIDQRLSDLAHKDFSGVVLVAENDVVILAKGYGFADKARKVQYTTDTVFDIGSITKPFTASAILRLEMDGKLKVTDPITKFFKDVPDDKKTITLHHLLTHTAGFEDALGHDYDQVGREQFVKLALSSRLRAAPGKSYSYSNVGYSLLGAVIEQLTGASYEKYLQDSLFKPAGMTKTGYVLPKWVKAELARGYQNDKDWGTPLDRDWAEDGPYWHLRANGGLLSTVGDLYRWSVALQGEDILSKEAKGKQFAPHASEGLLGGGNDYGYGWSIGKARNGKPVWAHNGSNGVFFSDFRIYPRDRLVLILATNASGLKYMSELSDVARVVLSEPKK
jgi:CubicO group peptidase (beta-lactamase class C family)